MQKLQRQFLGEESSAEYFDQFQETADDHELQHRDIVPKEISFQQYLGRQSPDWIELNQVKQNSNTSSSRTLKAKLDQNSFKNLNQFDSDHKKITINRSPSFNYHSNLFVSFVEKLSLRESLWKIQEYLQNFESIILTMCCKENPDLYNSLIVDLQGFSDLNQSTHWEVLSVVVIQSERLSKLLASFLNQKYDMSQFKELMCSIISPSAVPPQISQFDQDSDRKENHLRQKSFSFEGSSAGIKQHRQNLSSSGGNFKGMMHSKKSMGQTNPFFIEQTSSPMKIDESLHSHEQSQSDEYQNQKFQEESQESPLRLEDVKICNEMIGRLKAECNEYELTIVEQDREIVQLREIIRSQNPNQDTRFQGDLERFENQSLMQRAKQEIRQLRSENDQLQAQIYEQDQVLMNQKEQLREAKTRMSEPRRQDSRREAELQMQNRELESLKNCNHSLVQKFNEMQDTLKQKEFQIIEVEKQAQKSLRQAQTDAEECIAYFKTLALQSKGQTPQNKDQIFPNSLGPSQKSEVRNSTINNEDDFTNKSILKQKTRSKSAGINKNMFWNKEDFSFRQLNPDSVEQVEGQEPCIIQIALDAMSKAFEEVSQVKQGLIYQLTQFRDIYFEKQKSFSILSYDYIEKLTVYSKYDLTIKNELEQQSALVQELKSITMNQTKHIKAQNELILAQRDKFQIFTEFTNKNLKRKERERSSICNFAFTELPLLSETLVTTQSRINQLKENLTNNSEQFQQLQHVHELSKTKIRLLEEELEKSLQLNNNAEQIADDYHSKYERLTGLVQDIWIAEVKGQELNPKSFSFIKDISDQQSLSSEMVPMPINWLSDIRDTLRHLKETNNFQKDECFQMLNLLNTSVYNDQSEGQTYVRSEDEDEDSSGRGINEIASDESKSKQYSSFRPEEVLSPRPMTMKSITLQRINNRKLKHQITEKNELERPRYASADAEARGLTSQRTPKNVRFNQPATAISSNRSNQKIVSSGGSLKMSTKDNRNELQQMLREEICKIKRDYQISRETVVQMQMEIKSLRKELHESNCDTEQSNQDLRQQIERSEQLLQDLQQANAVIEDAENGLQNKDVQIDQLQTQILDFESELQDLQQSMANVAMLNNEISNQCENWEICHDQIKNELQSEKEKNSQQLDQLIKQNKSKKNTLINQLKEKESSNQNLQQEIIQLKEKLQQIDDYKRNVKDQGIDCSNDFIDIQNENDTLKQQLQLVKNDVTAVLEQYDRQNNKNKLVKGKYLKQKQQNEKFLQEIKDLKLSNQKQEQLFIQQQVDINKLGQDKDSIQDHYQAELSQEQQLNEQLQIQIQELAHLVEELQQQNQNSQHDLEEIKQQNDENINKLQDKIRELNYDNHQALSVIKKQREKIASYKRKRQSSKENESRPREHGQSQQVTRGAKFRSQSRELGSSDDQQDQKPAKQNQQIKQTPQNPFNNLSNLSNVLDSIKIDRSQCLSVNSCGNQTCVHSQNTKPSFHQPAQQDYQELKWKEEANQQQKLKVKKVIKFIEDLLKLQIQVHQNESEKNLHQNVQQWSSDQMVLDCWHIEESSIIEAKAFFNKHSPTTLTCLKILSQHNKSSKESYQQQLTPTLASSRVAMPVHDRSEQSSRQQNDEKQQDIIEAYTQLAQHCQQILQNYIQYGRALASICFGGCILVGSNLTQETKDKVDFAVKFLSQDTSLLESTSQEKMIEINSTIDNLISCLQQIVKSSCQVILNRSSMSKHEANKVLESFCDVKSRPSSMQTNHITSNKDKVSEHTFAHNSQEHKDEVQQKLQNVEHRLKSKFHHVQKLERSLSQLLNEENKDTIGSSNSVLTDTKTVIKLLSTVQRVVSKLKIELHQDYLQVGNINVGLFRNTSSVQSYQNTSSNTDLVHMPQSLLITDESVQPFTKKHQSDMQKLIQDMSHLTFEDTLRRK